MANPITQIILTAVDRTKAAFTSAKSGIDSIGTASAGVTGLLRNLFAGLSVIYFVGKLRNVVDEMTNVSDSAQRAGTSVENLTALQYAGQQSGIDDMQKSLVALSAALDSASTGTGEAARAFATLKVDPTQFDDPAVALEVLADRFSQLPEGVTKTNLAIDIFGKKIGPGMLPFLNKGAAGVRELKGEASAAGKVMSTEAAAAADKFGDSLDKLKGHTAGAVQGLVGGLLPSLNEYMAAMDDVLKNGSALDKIRFFTLGNINQDTLDRITSSTEKLAIAQGELNKATAAAEKIGRGDTAYIARQRALVKSLEDQVAAENKAAKAKLDNAKVYESAAKKAEEASERADEARKDEVKSLKESVNEQISDAQRLQGALQSAFEESSKAEEDYLKQAKKLRAEANGSTAGDGPEAQALAALDATIAAMKLQRTAATESLDSVQQQAEALRQLADGIEDVSKKEYLRRQANLAEAAALERAAADERARYQGLSEQQTEAARRSENLKASLDGIGKEVSVDIKPGPQTQQLITDLDLIISKISVINTTPVSPGAGASGYASSMSDALRTEALKRGNRR